MWRITSYKSEINIVAICAKLFEQYNVYFIIPVGDQDKLWVPHFTHELCIRTVEDNMEIFTFLNSGISSLQMLDFFKI